MNNNFRSFIFVFLFFSLANIVFGQANDGRLRHRIAWTKDDYALQYEVVIEKEQNNVFSPMLREFTEEPFIFISLPPGNYRLRVIPYDFRDIPGEGTGWKNFRILAAATPDSESQLVMDDLSELLPEQEEVADLTTPENRRGPFYGLFAEGLGYTRYNTAFGGGITFGRSFNGKGMGISLLHARDAEKFIFLEALAHFRFYLSRAKNNTGLFLQAEGGIVFFGHEKFQIINYLIPEDDPSEEWRLPLALVGGLSAGWRFPLGTRGYIEPAIRGGYPYIFGVSLSTGLRFD